MLAQRMRVPGEIKEVSFGSIFYDPRQSSAGRIPRWSENG
jgi:hypothetical protein